MTKLRDELNEDIYLIILELQTVSIVSPIFNHSGKAIASISVAGAKQRFNKEILEKCEEGVKRYARDISAMLGYKYKG